MLLHWLLLKDSSFSEHCLEVLHMYDQVIPAIRDTLRLVPDLSESEGEFVSVPNAILSSLNIWYSTFKHIYLKISPLQCIKLYYITAELALEEICRSETEYVEDMDMETGSWSNTMNEWYLVYVLQLSAQKHSVFVLRPQIPSYF